MWEPADRSAVQPAEVSTSVYTFWPSWLKKWRFWEVRGSRRGRVELQSAEVEVDRGLEVFPVAVAAGGDADRLDAGVQAFGAGVGDRVGEVGQQARLVALERLGGVDDRLEPGVGGPEVPAFEVLGRPAATLVGPEVPQALLDRPGPGGLQITGAQDGEPVGVLGGEVLIRVQPQVLRPGQGLVAGRGQG